MINTETLRVQPITYKLSIDDEAMKKLRPFFKLHSGSYSKITKIIDKPASGSPKGSDVVKLQRKEEGKVTVELWDRNSSKSENLIGRGELNYDSLSSKEGQYEEWVLLYDKHGKEVGKALLEVHITPVDTNLNIDGIFHRSIEDFNHSFKRAIEDMNKTFEHFDRFALPGPRFPSLLNSSSPRHEAIEQENPSSELNRSPRKKLTESKHSESQLSKRNEEQNKVMTHRRSLFDSAFEDMNEMFERTLEDMHNRFEEMTKDMFSGFGRWEEEPLNVESDKSKGSEKLENEKPISPKKDLRGVQDQRRIATKSKNGNKIGDEQLKHARA